MRIKTFVLLLALAALPGTFLALGGTLVTPNPYPSSPPCTLGVPGVYLWMGSYPSGWSDFTCVDGYTGDLTITVALIPYSSGFNATVSPVPIAEATESWPRTYLNPQCTYWGRLLSCPLGEPAWLSEYAPASGRVSADAYTPGGVCFKTQVRLEWFDSQRLAGGWEVAESAWAGSCY